jgi:hypothetical protein
VVGLLDLIYLRDQEVFSQEEVQECFLTYLVGILRTVRFGALEAHGRSGAVQLNFLLKEGAFQLDPKKGEIALQPKKFEPAIQKLAKELLEIEGTGSYERAGRLLTDLGSLDDATRALLARTESVPVDVTFTYPM